MALRDVGGFSGLVGFGWAWEITGDRKYLDIAVGHAVTLAAIGIRGQGEGVWPGLPQQSVFAVVAARGMRAGLIADCGLRIADCPSGTLKGPVRGPKGGLGNGRGGGPRRIPARRMRKGAGDASPTAFHAPECARPQPSDRGPVGRSASRDALPAPVPPFLTGWTGLSSELPHVTGHARCSW